MPNNKQHGPSMNTQTCQTASLAPSVPSSKSGTTRAKQRAWHHSVAISKLLRYLVFYFCLSLVFYLASYPAGYLVFDLAISGMP